MLRIFHLFDRLGVDMSGVVVVPGVLVVDALPKDDAWSTASRAEKRKVKLFTRMLLARRMLQKSCAGIVSHVVQAYPSVKWTRFTLNSRQMRTTEYQCPQPGSPPEPRTCDKLLVKAN